MFQLRVALWGRTLRRRQTNMKYATLQELRSVSPVDKASHTPSELLNELIVVVFQGFKANHWALTGNAFGVELCVE